MFLYTVLEAVAAIVIGLVLAIRTKKEENVVYGALDKVGKFTNIILMLAYICFAPVYLFLGMISSPSRDGFLGILGWMISILIASASLFCWIGLGASVSLRKKGRSKASFAVQFAGVVGIGLTVLLYFTLTGSILEYLN